MRLGEEYDNLPPLYVTENGAAYDDTVSDDGRVHDVERSGYIVDHVWAVRGAIADGADIRGYFVWFIARQLRVGLGPWQALRHRPLDYESQLCTIKASGREYARIISSSERPAPMVVPGDGVPT